LSLHTTQWSTHNATVVEAFLPAFCAAFRSTDNDSIDAAVNSAYGPAQWATDDAALRAALCPAHDDSQQAAQHCSECATQRSTVITAFGNSFELAIDPAECPAQHPA
jgi:hypothetical protein